MRNKLIAAFLIVIFAISTQLASMTLLADNLPLSVNKAETLKELGLFAGSDKGFELDRKPTRAEAAVMLVRLLGKESFAKASSSSTNFSDVPAWANPYIGYLFSNKLTFGISSTQYGSNSSITAVQFLTFVLRSLGYSDSLGDFNIENVLDKAKEVGLISDSDASNYKNNPDFFRADIVNISYNALKAKLKKSNKTLIEKLIFDEKAVSEETADKYSLNNNAYSASGVISNIVTDASGYNLTVNIEGAENTYHIDGAVLSALVKGIFVNFDVASGKISKFTLIGNYNYNYGVNGDYNCYLFRIMAIDAASKVIKLEKFSSEVNYQYGDEYSYNYDNDLNIYDASNKDLVMGGKSINDLAVNDYVWIDRNNLYSGSKVQNIVKINVGNMVVPKIIYLDNKGVVIGTGIDANGPIVKINLAGYVKTFNLSDSVANLTDFTKGNYIEFLLGSSNKITSVDSTKTSTSASSSINIFRISNLNTTDKMIKCYRLKTNGTNLEDTSTAYYFLYDPNDLTVYDVTDKDAIKGSLQISDLREGNYIWMNNSALNTSTKVTKILKINVDDIVN